jgi:hypothetical protein
VPLRQRQRQRQEIQAVLPRRDGASVVDLAEGIGGEVVVVPGFDHHCCWSRVWAEIAEFPT